MASSSLGEGSDNGEFSVLVLGSDLTVDARSFLEPLIPEEHEVWHECLEEEDFSDIEQLQTVRIEGTDRHGNRIIRIVGKFFPAVVISGKRLKEYIFQKILKELPQGPFCILYMHSDVQNHHNSPGISNLRWIYEELPLDFKERLVVVYFLHPGIRSRLFLATMGRAFLSAGLYWKINYVSRLQYLWENIEKGQVEIPEFVMSHDNILEYRPLTDYGIEPDSYHLTDPLNLTGAPTMVYSYRRNPDGLPSREYQ